MFNSWPGDYNKNCSCIIDKVNTLLIYNNVLNYINYIMNTANTLKAFIVYSFLGWAA